MEKKGGRKNIESGTKVTFWLEKFSPHLFQSVGGLVQKVMVRGGIGKKKGQQSHKLYFQDQFKSSNFIIPKKKKRRPFLFPRFLPPLFKNWKIRKPAPSKFILPFFLPFFSFEQSVFPSPPPLTPSSFRPFLHLFFLSFLFFF